MESPFVGQVIREATRRPRRGHGLFGYSGIRVFGARHSGIRGRGPCRRFMKKRRLIREATRRHAKGARIIRVFGARHSGIRGRVPCRRFMKKRRLIREVREGAHGIFAYSGRGIRVFGDGVRAAAS